MLGSPQSRWTCSRRLVCTGNANSHLSQYEDNHTLKWHFLGSNRNPSSAKFRLKYSPCWKLPDQEHRRRLWTFGSEKPKYKKKMSHKKNFPVVKSELDWQKELSPDEYHVLRQKGTEMAGTGEYNKFYPKPGEGYFECRACKNPLYSAASKFDSGCGCTYFLFPSPTPNHPRIFY